MMSDKSWIRNNYGSRRGLLRTCIARLMYFSGKYRKYRQIDWESIERLVFVCTGNICRSPYAEAIARNLGVDALSCGLQAIEGAQVNELTLLTARKNGINLGSHRTMPIMYLTLRKTDLLIVMEPEHARFIRHNLGRRYQCTLLGIWSNPVLPYIHDPFGSSPAYFEKCFAHIEKSVNVIVKKIK